MSISSQHLLLMGKGVAIAPCWHGTQVKGLGRCYLYRCEMHIYTDIDLRLRFYPSFWFISSSHMFQSALSILEGFRTDVR